MERLEQLFQLARQTRAVKASLVEELLRGGSPSPDAIRTLEDARATLRAIPRLGDRFVLEIDEHQRIELELDYELGELDKDLVYLRDGEEALLRHAEMLRPGFGAEVDAAIAALEGRRYRCFLSDRDGTLNNYCGRYLTSVQSVYNAVFLTRFARRLVETPIILTSAPLANPGIVDVSVLPAGEFVLAASGGRELLDRRGLRHAVPINPRQLALLEQVNARLAGLLTLPRHARFGLIGSGLQRKHGQTSVARQDISGSVPALESAAFLEELRDLVRALDPAADQLTISDTGLDVEIAVAGPDAARAFDKGEAVRYLDRLLGLDLARGAHLICGDTSADVPMIEAARDLAEQIQVAFVTTDPALADRVRAISPDTHVVPTPDVLVWALARLEA